MSKEMRSMGWMLPVLAILIFVSADVEATNVSLNYVWNSTHWIPWLSTTDGKPKVDIDFTNLTTGSLTVNGTTLYADSNNARVGIGTTSPNELLQVVGTSDPTIRIQHPSQATGITAALDFTTSTNGAIASARIDAKRQSDGSVDMQFFGGDVTSQAVTTAQMYLDGSSGKVGIGTTSPLYRLTVANDAGDAVVSVSDAAASANGPVYYLYKSRGTHASPAIVANGDNIGRVESWAHDGTQHHNVARMEFAVDGTPGAGDMPTRITFWTTPDGSAGPSAERLRIDSSGNVGIGTTGTLSKLDVVGAISARNGISNTPYLEISGTSTAALFKSTNTGASSAQPFVFQIENSEVMRIATNGNVGIGNSSPTHKLHVAGNGLFEGELGIKKDNSDSFRTWISGHNTDAVGTTAKTIYTGLSGVRGGKMFIVSGHETGKDFIDLVLLAGSGTTPAVVSNDENAGPASRTYSVSGDNLQLAMGSGSYDVTVQHFGVKAD